MIDHVHPSADLLAAELFHLLPAVLTMASDDDQDTYVFIGDTRLGNRVEQSGQDEVHALPAPGDVADGDGHFVRGTEQLPQGGESMGLSRAERMAPGMSSMAG